MGHPLDKLKGGDRRSIGRSNEVVRDVLNDPSLYTTIVEGMLHDDPLVRMRAADAAEKISVKHPEYLKPFKKILLNKIARTEAQEVRWHVAQMIPRLGLNRRERQTASRILFAYLNDRSRIVVTFSLQALTELAEEDEDLRENVIHVVEEWARKGSPAVKSRAKKLLKKLNGFSHRVLLKS